MIRKAFLRNGILASRDIESDLSVEIKENHILLYKQDQSPMAITSIEELLNHILI